MFRLNFGINPMNKEQVLSPEIEQKVAVKWWKGLAGYRKYAKIERKNESGVWVGVKLVEKSKA